METAGKHLTFSQPNTYEYLLYSSSVNERGKIKEELSMVKIVQRMLH